MVVEKLEELRHGIIYASKQLGVEPMIGIRAAHEQGRLG